MRFAPAIAGPPSHNPVSFNDLASTVGEALTVEERHGNRYRRASWPVAFCSARAPASVIGLIAPARLIGVATTGWPLRAISMSPSDIGPSRRRGLFGVV